VDLRTLRSCSLSGRDGVKQKALRRLKTGRKLVGHASPAKHRHHWMEGDNDVSVLTFSHEHAQGQVECRLRGATVLKVKGRDDG
jgi:hypothetical protein